MEINIKNKMCPGCGILMFITKIEFLMKTRAFMQWYCNKCNRGFGFYFKQETEALNPELSDEQAD